MQKQSLFQKYFRMFSFSAIVCIVGLGATLLLFASRFFEDEKYAMLEKDAAKAAFITSEHYSNVPYLSVDQDLINTYFILSSAIDAEILLVDLSGNIIIGAGMDPTEQRLVFTIPQEAIDAAVSKKYKSVDDFSGFFLKEHYIVGVPVMHDNNVVAALFTASSTDGLTELLGELIKIFIFSSLLVLFVFAAAIYVLTLRLVQPLRSILLAMQSFSKGDFSKRVVITGEDEIGQLATEFNNMASTLAVTEQSRRTFIANVSHELKTPMTTIVGFVDGILDGTIPKEKHEQYLRVVSAEVKRLSRLVRSMLDSTRIEAGEMSLNLVKIDISEIIRKIIFTFEKDIDEKQLEIRGLDVDKISVTADPDLMHQVIYNLIENAVKFVDNNGYISIDYRSDAQNTYISIKNSGSGVCAQELPKLFDRFYKADKSRSLNKKGTGLGLHIVRSIVNYHNGEINVTSVENEYTMFEFSLPTIANKVSLVTS